MALPRFERASPEIRVALLEAAADEFAKHGYESASVNRILASAGLSKGAFYYYFDDKADLAATVLAGETRAWLETFRALAVPNTPEEFWDGMERINERMLAQLAASPRHSDLLLRLGRSAVHDPDLKARLAPVLQSARGEARSFYLRGQQLGAIRGDISVETLVSIFQGAKEALTLALLPADRAPTPEELAELGRLNLDLLRRIARPAERPAEPPRPKAVRSGGARRAKAGAPASKPKAGRQPAGVERPSRR